MNETTRSIFSGMQILLMQDYSFRWTNDSAVVVEDDRIKAVISTDMIKHHLPATRHEFPADHYLIPGFIDLHVHGARGHDVMDATPEAFAAISYALAMEGVTSYLATTMTAPTAQIEKVLTSLTTYVSENGATILGVHLEGPFIAKSRLGAQPDYTQDPDITLFKHWQHLANGAIKLVTLAPELPGAIPFIQSLHSMSVLASIGHTNASYDQTLAAISAGCTQATHLFNAMSALHHRDLGPAGALLLADWVKAELIVDGIHLSAPVVELILRVKGKDRLILVTDAMRGKCLENGCYDLGGQSVNVKDGKATLENGTLAGSTLRMPQAIANMIAFSRCSLPDAIGMASLNPARVLGLEARKGSIAVGKDADVVVMKPDLSVAMTMIAGKSVFQS